MRNYTVAPEFKAQVNTILETKKFSTVFPFMNLIKREGNIYSEQELNSIVQFLGDFAYNEVAGFFQSLPSLVQEITATANGPVSAADAKVAEEVPAETEA